MADAPLTLDLARSGAQNRARRPVLARSERADAVCRGGPAQATALPAADRAGGGAGLKPAAAVQWRSRLRAASIETGPLQQ